MPAKRFNEADIDFDAIDGEIGETCAAEAEPDGCAGPFAEAAGRATGEGRDGGSNA